MRKAAILLPLILLAAMPVEAAPIPPGPSGQSVQLDGLDFDVLTYRPNCANPTLLLSFHGSLRRPEAARRSVRRLADRLCFLVLAPGFDAERFPPWRYHGGGIGRGGVVQDPKTWSGRFAMALVEWARAQERRPLAYSLVGHSAGGQFVGKLIAFTPNEARRIVIANPLFYIEANTDVRSPKGLGGVYAGDEADANLRRYLSQPVSLLLGQMDKGFAEGRGFYARARELAASKGWTFNWRLIEVPGIGHDADAMFASPQAERAIRP